MWLRGHIQLLNKICTITTIVNAFLKAITNNLEQSETVKPYNCYCINKRMFINGKSNRETHVGKIRDMFWEMPILYNYLQYL